MKLLTMSSIAYLTDHSVSLLMISIPSWILYLAIRSLCLLSPNVFSSSYLNLSPYGILLSLVGIFVTATQEENL